jgi:hypothetical protein
VVRLLVEEVQVDSVNEKLTVKHVIPLDKSFPLRSGSNFQSMRLRTASVRLAVGEVFDILQNRHQGQSPGGLGRLPARGEEIGKVAAAAYTVFTRSHGPAPPNLHAGAMVLHGERIVLSWHVTDNTKLPRLDGALPEVAYGPALTATPDQSGLCGAVACPAPPRGPAVVGGACRACGLRADDALPHAGGVAGVHTPRPSGSAGTVKRVVRTRGAAQVRGRVPGETVAVEAA